MSLEPTAQAEHALWMLGGRECEWEGGLIGPNGKCGNDFCAHCPFCFASPECLHEVARWDDDNGYCGPTFPAPPEEDDEAVLDALKAAIERVRTLLAQFARATAEQEAQG